MRCYSHSLLVSYYVYLLQGVCGLPESQDTPRALAYKLDKLVELVQKSNYTVALTGAGISTSAGIPDFRGPHGIWTKEQQQRKLEKRQQQKKKTKRKKDSLMGENDGMQDNNSSSNDNDTNSSNSSSNNNTRQYISFESAVPTYTHKALTHLILNPPTITTNNNDNNNDQSSTTTSTNNSIKSSNRTYLHHIVTQNVDGLHHKTSLPRNKYSILHGCIFTEICDTCSTEYVRPYEIQSIGLQYTGRYCTQSSCVGGVGGVGVGKLKDTLLDWEDPLPQVEWDTAQSVCSKADLILCLGTSLRIEPAGSLCTFTTTGNNNSNGCDDDDDDDDDEGKEKRSKKRKKQSTTSTPRVHHQSTKTKKLGYVIINLQPTPYDDGATLIIRAKVDDVMQFLMHKLGYTL
jgi:mono-ADP-ribosyltransferase sirtuin 6